MFGDGSTTFNSEANLFWDSTNDRLGIGVNTPSQQLHLQKLTASSTALVDTQFNASPSTVELRSARTSNANLATNDVVGTVAFNARHNSTNAAVANIKGVYTGDGTTQVGDVVVEVSNSGAAAETLRVAANGLVTSVGALKSKTSLILEDPGAGTNTVTIQAPTLSGDYTLTLPVDDGTPNQILQTNGSGVLSWVDSAGSGTVNTGTAGRLAVYPSTGTTVDDTYTQNSNNIDVAIATHAGLAAAREYTIPDAGADASFVMTESAQTINGVKTFSATPLLKTALDIEDPGAGTNKITIQAGTVSASYTVTLPTAQGAANTTLVNNGSGVLSWTVQSVGKANIVSLSQGTTTKAITFNTANSTANYSINWAFKNTAGSSPAQRSWNVIAQSTTGFTIEWNDAIEDSNYSALWSIVDHYDP